MPTKRTAKDPPAASSKRSKTTASSSTSTDLPPPSEPLRSKRWSAVSVSGNLQMSYLNVRDYDTYECLCQARVDGKMADDDDDDEDENSDSEDEDGQDGDSERRSQKAKCDNGETCMCKKPAAEYPEHPFTTTVAGKQKLIHQMIHTDLRCPDAFDMYVFNDFAGYGIFEVLENLVLDFVEAKQNWKEQWAVCQALPFYWMTDAPMPMTMADVGDAVEAIWELLGHMFLAMLATFEEQGLMRPDSEVKNLGMVMSLYLSLAEKLRQYGCLDDNIRRFGVSRFDAYIVAYARKYSIKLQGPSRTDKRVNYIEGAGDFDKFQLPIPGADPWKFAAAHKAYAREYGPNAILEGKKAMGGDASDISSWASARRKKYAFNKKDPLGKKEIDAIKQGSIIQVG